MKKTAPWIPLTGRATITNAAIVSTVTYNKVVHKQTITHLGFRFCATNRKSLVVRFVSMFQKTLTETKNK